MKSDAVLKLHCAVLGLGIKHVAYCQLCAVCGKQRLSNNEIARRLGISPAAVSQRRNKIDRLMSEVREVL